MSSKGSLSKAAPQRSTISLNKKKNPEELTFFTTLIYVFTGLVVAFLVFAVSYVTYEGLFVSNRSINPETNAIDVRLAYNLPDEQGKVLPYSEQLDFWWYASHY